MRRSISTLWRLLAVLSLLGVTEVLGLPATHAADRTPALLRYAFKQGALFTMHFNLTSSKTIQQPHYPDRHFHEVTTGLEQATIAKVLRDGGALFQYRFAGLVTTGMASPAQYVIDARCRASTSRSSSVCNHAGCWRGWPGGNCRAAVQAIRRS